MNKKCKRKGCNNICVVPAWIYCSDECNRLSLNGRFLIARHKRENKNNV